MSVFVIVFLSMPCNEHLSFEFMEFIIKVTKFMEHILTSITIKSVCAFCKHLNYNVLSELFLSVKICFISYPTVDTVAHL
jgi:hypothetical protein